MSVSELAESPPSDSLRSVDRPVVNALGVMLDAGE
jgi:hypothetical protein